MTELERERADQFAVNVNRAAAHPRDDARVFHLFAEEVEQE